MPIWPGRGVQTISTGGITNNLLSEIPDSPSTVSQFVADLNRLAKDVQSGNLSAAQQDYVTISEDALSGAASSATSASATAIPSNVLSDIESSSTHSSSILSELDHLGTDLDNGDLTSARADILSLYSTALKASSLDSPGATSSTTSAESSTHIESARLIQATIQAASQAIHAGADAGISTDISQLAVLLSSLPRLGYFEQEKEGDDPGFSSNSIGQMLQSLDVSTSPNFQYALSLFAWYLLRSSPPSARRFRDRNTREKLRRVVSRQFAEANWPIHIFLAGFQEPEDLREALDYIVSERPLRNFAHRIIREADAESTPAWQRELIDEMANRIKNENA